MASAVHAVSADRHAGKTWRPLRDYRHAQSRTFVGVALSELPHAVRSFPLAFIVQNNIASLVAVLGLVPNSNLFVASDGTWLGGYIPALLRAHPFAIAQDNDQQVLCIDEATGLAGPEEENTRPFFDEGGALSKPTADVVQFLQSLNAQLERGRQAATLLLQHNVLEPWPIQMRGAAGEAEQKIEGLLRVNEAALNSLPDEAFLKLRAGALPLAYGQLLSMANLQNLPRIAEMRQARERQIQQRRAEEAAMFQADTGNQDVIDWDRMFKD